MKKLLVILLLGIFVIPTFNSCKKGENDPSISFKSRKARLVGEWSLKEGALTQVSSGATANIIFNGSSATITSTSINTSFPYTYDISIKKDGTFESTQLSDGDLTVDEGQWYFMSGNKDKDLKNKECVAFVVTKESYTPAGGSLSVASYSSVTPDFVWQLDELKSKEIIVIYNSSSTESTTNSNTGTMTYEAK